MVFSSFQSTNLGVVGSNPARCASNLADYSNGVCLAFVSDGLIFRNRLLEPDDTVLLSFRLSISSVRDALSKGASGYSIR